MRQRLSWFVMVRGQFFYSWPCPSTIVDGETAVLPLIMTISNRPKSGDVLARLVAFLSGQVGPAVRCCVTFEAGIGTKSIG